MPEFGQARAIQIDVDAKQIGMRYPYEINLVADAKSALAALIPLLAGKTDRAWRESIESSVEHWRNTLQRQAMTDSDRSGTVNPMRLVYELSPRIPPNAMVSSDSGSAANWYARLLDMRADMRGSLSGNLATMGPGVPYAIGAKFAHPDRPAVAIVGDGAMQMNGLAELITVAHYWQEWSDPRLVVAVIHNNDLNQVTWEMRAMAGAPKFAESQTIPDVSYAEAARTFGLDAVEVHDPDEIGPAWEKAFAATRPTVLDVHCDPDVPPIPPHADWAQMKATAKAVLGGDEDAAGVVRTGIKQKVQEFLPGHKASE
jgi:pyruvate dehydrogenase (quinone)